MVTVKDDDPGIDVAAEPAVPRRAQFFTSLDEPMPSRAEVAGSLDGAHPTMEGRPSSDVASVWYDFGTESNPGRVFVVKYGPGYVNSAHAHDTDYCSVVVEGSVDIARRTFGPGSIRFVKAETTYGPVVVGPDGATVIEFFPGPPGGTSRPVDERGADSQPYDFFTPAARARLRAAVGERAPHDLRKLATRLGEPRCRGAQSSSGVSPRAGPHGAWSRSPSICESGTRLKTPARPRSTSWPVAWSTATTSRRRTNCSIAAGMLST